MPHQPAAKPAHPLVKDFLSSHRLDWSDQHRSNGLSHLNRWVRWCTARDVAITAAESEHCVEFLGERKGQIGSATLTKDYQFLNWFYAWCHEEGELDGANPMRRIKGPGKVTHDPRRTPYIAEADYERLMSSFDKRKRLDCRNAAICSLMFRSGIRRSEVARADLDRLDLDHATLEIFGKNQQWEKVPLAAETCRLLERYLRRRGEDNCPALFVGATVSNGRLAAPSISEMLQRRQERLGIHLPAHAFRRAMAIHGKRYGLNDTTVQSIGRWTDPRMVARYQRGAQAELAAAEFHQHDPTAQPTRRRRRRAS